MQDYNESLAVGYSSKDGNLVDSSTGVPVLNFGPQFGEGDTIGVGMDYANYQVCCSRNQSVSFCLC